MSKLRLGDEVVVLAGKDRNRRGKVKSFHSPTRVVVEGINMVKKHVRPNPQLQVIGGIESMEAPIHISNLALYNPSNQKAERVGYKTVDGKKVRFFRTSGNVVGASVVAATKQEPNKPSDNPSEGSEDSEEGVAK